MSARSDATGDERLTSDIWHCIPIDGSNAGTRRTEVDDLHLVRFEEEV
jgi:hypothetical protein